MEKDVCESRSLPDEMLYGRAGYLYTLLHLQKELGEHTVNKQSIINVCSIKMLTYCNLLFVLLHICLSAPSIFAGFLFEVVFSSKIGAQELCFQCFAVTQVATALKLSVHMTKEL